MRSESVVAGIAALAAATLISGCEIRRTAESATRPPEAHATGQTNDEVLCATEILLECEGAPDVDLQAPPAAVSDELESLSVNDVVARIDVAIAAEDAYLQCMEHFSPGYRREVDQYGRTYRFFPPNHPALRECRTQRGAMYRAFRNAELDIRY